MGTTASQTIVDGEAYVQGRVFGKGSFGKVYLMKHKPSGKNRVFKEMSKAEILKRSAGSAKVSFSFFIFPFFVMSKKCR